jgi:hypothetical protein
MVGNGHVPPSFLTSVLDSVAGAGASTLYGASVLTGAGFPKNNSLIFANIVCLLAQVFSDRLLIYFLKNVAEQHK